MIVSLGRKATGPQFGGAGQATYDLSFLLSFKLLMELSKTGCAIVVRITTCHHQWGACDGLWTGSRRTAGLYMLMIRNHFSGTRN